jgi:pathogenesis-related protein 1
MYRIVFIGLILFIIGCETDRKSINVAIPSPTSTPTPTSTSTSTSTPTPVASTNGIVKRHNYYRRLEFTDSDLTWDATLASHAQQWADYLALNYTQANASSGASPHASQFNSQTHGLPYKGEGENIAWASANLYYILDNPVDISVEGSSINHSSHKFGAVDMWANEKAYYDYSSNSGNGRVVGHYTQIVWQKTTKVGCGKAISKNDHKGSYVVCRYSIAGNMIGDKPYCKNYTLSSYYNNSSLTFTANLIKSKTFVNTKILEDREKCIVGEGSTETLVFNSDGSGTFQSFDFFNNGGYVADFKFTTVIDNGILKMSGDVNGNLAIMSLKLIGQDNNHYFVDAQWSLNRDIQGYYRQAIFKLAI